jgi:S-adenosylhomocysteine hydrolase
MDAVLMIVLPGFAAVASGVLAWFIMQSRMEVMLAQQRERMAETRGALDAERSALENHLGTALKAAEATAKLESLENFMSELRVEQRHYTRDNKMLMHNRKSLVLQERMYFRNIPLSDWIEHEIMLEDGADVGRLVQDMTVFDKSVISITEAPRTGQKQLA